MAELDGKPVAKQIKAEVKASAEAYRAQGVVPVLAIVIATDDGGAWWYVRSIEKSAAACAIEVRVVEQPTDADTAALAATLQQLADDDSVHAILLQTPLPAGADVDELMKYIPPEKDVDGLNPLSAGRLLYGETAFAPATAEAVTVLLKHYQVALAGKHAVVVGRSRVVGKPVANLLLEADATVTICHSRTVDLPAQTRRADILVVAAGKPGLITPDMVSPGTVVVDVGTTVVGDHKLAGDVDPAVSDVAAGLTPVPGGVGSVTTSLILQHTLTSVSFFHPKR